MDGISISVVFGVCVALPAATFLVHFWDLFLFFGGYILSICVAIDPKPNGCRADEEAIQIQGMIMTMFSAILSLALSSLHPFPDASAPKHVYC